MSSSLPFTSLSHGLRCSLRAHTNHPRGGWVRFYVTFTAHLSMTASINYLRPPEIAAAAFDAVGGRASNGTPFVLEQMSIAASDDAIGRCRHTRHLLKCCALAPKKKFVVRISDPVRGWSAEKNCHMQIRAIRKFVNSPMSAVGSRPMQSPTQHKAPRRQRRRNEDGLQISINLPSSFRRLCRRCSVGDCIGRLPTALSLIIGEACRQFSNKR